MNLLEKTNLIIALSILLIGATCFGQTVYGNSELPAGAFLWLPGDAATEALGGAATANGGISSGWANPAALFEGTEIVAGATYGYLREKTTNSGLFVSKRRGNWAGATRLFLVNSVDIEARTGPTEEPDYYFAAHQLYLQMTGARRFGKYIDLGFSAKWIREDIDQFDREGWVFDVGAAGGYKFFRAGIAVNNWGGKEVYFEDYRENYPITYRAGLSVKIMDYGMLTADWIKPDRIGGYTAIGAEGYVTEYLILRAGYTPGHDTRNISAGLGVNYAGFNIDYALANYSNNLGMSHTVTLSYSRKAN